MEMWRKLGSFRKDREMRYPTNEDELIKDGIMAWLADYYDGDADAARRAVKLQLAILELRDRGFAWTDI